MLGNVMFILKQANKKGTWKPHYRAFRKYITYVLPGVTPNSYVVSNASIVQNVTVINSSIPPSINSTPVSSENKQVCVSSKKHTKCKIFGKLQHTILNISITWQSYDFFLVVSLTRVRIWCSVIVYCTLFWFQLNSVNSVNHYWIGITCCAVLD